MDTVKSSWLGLPETDVGRWSGRLLVVFLVVFPTWIAYISLPEIPRPTFFSDPIHAVLLLTAAASAVLSAISGTWAMAFRGERSILTMASILLGGFVGWWGVVEIFFSH